MQQRKAQPGFDENKHKILNSVLKHLYTAVTRARTNVYIFDEDEEKRAPMFTYFKAHDLVTSSSNSGFILVSVFMIKNIVHPF